MRDWNRFFTEQDFEELIHGYSSIERRRITAERANKILREAIEAAPKVSRCADFETELWDPERADHDTHVGTLIDMKPIEKGDT